MPHQQYFNVSLQKYDQTLTIYEQLDQLKISSARQLKYFLCISMHHFDENKFPALEEIKLKFASLEAKFQERYKEIPLEKLKITKDIYNYQSDQYRDYFVFNQEGSAPESLIMIKPIERLRHFYEKIVYIWVVGQQAHDRHLQMEDFPQEILSQKQTDLEQTLIDIKIVGSLQMAIELIKEQFDEMKEFKRLISNKIEGLIFSDLGLATEIAEHSEICRFLRQIIYYPLHDSKQSLLQFQKWEQENTTGLKFLYATLSELRLLLKSKNIFPNFASLENQTSKDKSLRTLLKAFTNSEMRGQIQITTFLDLASCIYSQKKYQQAIFKLKSMYQKIDYGCLPAQDIIKIYTTPCFFHQLLNRMIRVSRTASQLICCESFIHDLHKGILQTYRLRCPPKDQFCCYRGTLYSPEQLNLLKNNIGKHIQIFGFLSTSLDEDVSKTFAVNTLIKIIVKNTDRNSEFDHGHIYVKEWSACPYEEEVLFNILNIFYVKSVKTDQAGLALIELEYGVHKKINELDTFFEHEINKKDAKSQLELYLSLQQSQESLCYLNQFLHRQELWNRQNFSSKLVNGQENLQYQIKLAQVKAKSILSLPKEKWTHVVPQFFESLLAKVHEKPVNNERRKVYTQILLLGWCQFIYESMQEENQKIAGYLIELEEKKLKNLFQEDVSLENMISCIYCYFKIKLLHKNESTGLIKIRNIIQNQLKVPPSLAPDRDPFAVYNNQFGIPKQMYLEIKGELLCYENNFKEATLIFTQAKKLDELLNGRRSELASSMLELVKELNFLNPYLRGNYTYSEKTHRYLRNELEEIQGKSGRVSIEFINCLIELGVERIQSGCMDEGLRYMGRCRELFGQYMKETKQPRFNDCQINRALKYENDYRQYKKTALKYFIIYLDLLLLGKYSIIIENICLIQQHILSHCGRYNEIYQLLLVFKKVALKFAHAPSIGLEVANGDELNRKPAEKKQHGQQNNEEFNCGKCILIDDYLEEINKGSYGDEIGGGSDIMSSGDIRKYLQQSPAHMFQLISEFQKQMDHNLRIQNVAAEISNIPLYCVEFQLQNSRYLFTVESLDTISYFEETHFSQYLKIYQDLEKKAENTQKSAELAALYAFLAEIKKKIGKYQSSQDYFGKAIQLIQNSVKNWQFYANIWKTALKEAENLEKTRKQSHFMIFL